MKRMKNNILRIALLEISLIIFLTLFASVAVAQNKVVVIPLFESVPSSSESLISMQDYKAPTGCVVTYRGYQNGIFTDPMMEVTYGNPTRTLYFCGGDICGDETDDIYGYLDNVTGYYTRYDQPVYGAIPLDQKKIGDTWADGYIQTHYDPNGAEYDKSSVVKIYTLLSLEDVVIDSVTYKDCLKIIREDPYRFSIYWRAKGIGTIKRISGTDKVGLSTYELSSCNCE